MSALLSIRMIGRWSAQVRRRSVRQRTEHLRPCRPIRIADDARVSRPLRQAACCGERGKFQLRPDPGLRLRLPRPCDVRDCIVRRRLVPLASLLLFIPCFLGQIPLALRKGIVWFHHGHASSETVSGGDGCTADVAGQFGCAEFDDGHASACTMAGAAENFGAPRRQADGIRHPSNMSLSSLMPCSMRSNEPADA